MNHREYEAFADICEHAAMVLRRLAVAAPKAQPGGAPVTTEPATPDDVVPQTLLLTVSEFAQLLRIGRASAYALIGSGEIPSITLGRSRRIPLRQLEAWIAGRADS